MLAMRKLRLVVGLTCLVAGVPALSVGLGPLSKEGVTGSAAKAFYLTLLNPYDEPRSFKARGYDLDGHMLERVQVHPSTIRMAANSERRIIVIARGLEPGEDFTFRVCAEQAGPNQGTIHARVCSRLRARRIGASAT